MICLVFLINNWILFTYIFIIKSFIWKLRKKESFGILVLSNSMNDFSSARLCYVFFTFVSSITWKNMLIQLTFRETLEHSPHILQTRTQYSFHSIDKQLPTPWSALKLLPPQWSLLIKAAFFFCSFACHAVRLSFVVDNYTRQAIVYEWASGRFNRQIVRTRPRPCLCQVQGQSRTTRSDSVRHSFRRGRLSFWEGSLAGKSWCFLLFLENQLHVAENNFL